ncbi:sacsin N-terminal ATP-binding-like domain-containing protein [Williamsia deligens]|uniref:Sacsin N-terminal ATP-binding-like domain-containing protein n=1 Tax=Williamsia deligens TaxID=321325 RepID=A0ABW3G8A8_9NOCA|nr:hypothetical protein [Williamsia deligens]MCP2192833.1 Histidine kinase-, DNA gyrase B-, and HSP90-like ATPase [Williamsia deligens]
MDGPRDAPPDPSGPSDPFDTASLRSAVLASWAASPTRLAEDAAAEADLVDIGYRDRVVTELIANAADAAAAAGIVGSVDVRSEPDGTVRVANTGAPLTADGVRSLSALRVSAKRDTADAVGRFGVGFSAVAAVADEVAVRSRHGGVVFSRARTDAALADTDLAVERAPMLRLPWPDPTPPADGWDTEIVLTPRGDGTSIVETAREQATTLLLELTALQSITVSGDVSERAVTDVDDPLHQVVTVGTRHWVQVVGERARWLMPGTPAAPRPVRREHLRAPTTTDVALTLPAICVADVDLTPDRRTLHPEARIDSAAVGYHLLASALAVDVRLAAVPVPGLPAGPIDAALREAVVADLTAAPWVPTASGVDVLPSRAVVLAGATRAVTDLLAEIVDGLLHADLGHPSLGDRESLALLRSVGVQELSWESLCDMLIGVQQPPTWWRDLYQALAEVAGDDHVREAIATVPVPRSDGRMSVGARGLVMIDAPAGPVTDALSDISVDWIATVHPEAQHPLLDRLGARRVGVSEVLTDPALEAMVGDGDVESSVVTAVLGLLAADPDATAPSWLGGLMLPDADGEDRPADELLLPGSPFAAVLVEDAPFGVVADSVVATWGADVLRRVGVGWGFTVLTDDLPIGPDHDLPDEERWWDSRSDEPQRVVAVRDLDLVDPDRWPEALSLLVADKDCRAALSDRDGYTAWWLRTFAELDGVPLGHLRAPDDLVLDGVLDPAAHPDAAAFAPALAGTEIGSTDLAAVVLDHLADPDRPVRPGVAAAAHAALVRAHRRGDLDLDRLDPPTRVRTLSGVATSTAVVVDRPWFLAVVSGDEAVVATPPTTPDDAVRLATVLDIPTAGEAVTVTPVDPGTATTWDADPTAVAFAVGRDESPRTGEVRVHDRLRLDVERDGERTVVDADWWVDDAGVHHLTRSGGGATR